MESVRFTVEKFLQIEEENKLLKEQLSNSNNKGKTADEIRASIAQAIPKEKSREACMKMLQMMADGVPKKLAAAQLGINYRTTELYLDKIRFWLNCNNVNHLMAYLIREGIIK